MRTDTGETVERFRRRVLAAVIDSLLLCLLVATIVLTRLAVAGSPPAAGDFAAGLADIPRHAAVLAAMVLAAQTLFWAFLAATPGMLLAGSRVVLARTGRRLSLLRSAIRALGLWVGLACLGVGVLWAIRDPRGQGLHDKLVGAVVVTEDESRIPLDELVGRFE